MAKRSFQWLPLHWAQFWDRVRTVATVINDYKVSTRAKHAANPFRCSRVHLCNYVHPDKIAPRSPGLKYLGLSSRPQGR